ncbi:MmcQ/YjbR family DNA-binding protein [Amycolatopsis panacis]|uniref:TfoX N-terminal domain-containing protein n=1 Tax=Amycolatopsis panacis TaxID=2340917 RepID=A0A419I6Z0_9PSEU|nr:MmcQ/YjbR family DNA-binding protein [Amycolatopsis panacis]RJQ87101.1 hypothetical protein D5S19_10610 [Amycolatopsis panacis]
MTEDERFEDLVDEFQRLPEVTPPGASRGFGSHALRVHNRIFAMHVRGRLVVKLPKSRVDALVEDGHGVRFDANKGTPMKEWLAVAPDSPLSWAELAREAMEFVVGARKR